MRGFVHGVTVFAFAAALAACSAGNMGFEGGANGDAASDHSAHDGFMYPDIQSTDTGTRTDSGTMLTPDSACATQTSGTTRAPMNLLILLDRSGSMGDNGKWDSAVAAINHILDTLVAMPDGTRVGLMFLPSSSNSDQISGYTSPVVPIADVTTTAPMIRAALAATGPMGNTPMACAETGAVQFLTSGFTMDGSRNIMIVTDGQPTEECSGVTCGLFDINCQLMASTLAETRVLASAAMGARSTPPVRTFVVGVPPAADDYLSVFADNGGTPRAPGCEMTNSCAYSTSTGTLETDLEMAFDDIRGRAATCQFEIMIDTTMADSTLVNVNYTPMPGSPSQIIPRDISHMNGWDYSGDMRSVILYGPACDDFLMNQMGGQIQILFGCPTVTPG